MYIKDTIYIFTKIPSNDKIYQTFNRYFLLNFHLNADRLSTKMISMIDNTIKSLRNCIIWSISFHKNKYYMKTIGENQQLSMFTIWQAVIFTLNYLGKYLSDQDIL